MPDFTCASCGTTFTVRPDVLSRFPGWTPRQCMPCKNGRPGVAGAARATGGAVGAGAAAGTAAGGDANLSARRPAARSTATPSGANRGATKGARSSATTLEADPQTGLFTDGACSGNPGPGGWGLVWVRDGVILAERAGRAERTTNNRMELMAMIEALRLLPADSADTIWSDSNLVVQTVNVWAAGWERRGWRRKDGPVENLDLVQQLWRERQAHPRVIIRWLKGHAGQTWNEHADRLATGAIRPGESAPV